MYIHFTQYTIEYTFLYLSRWISIKRLKRLIAKRFAVARKIFMRKLSKQAAAAAAAAALFGLRPP